MSHTAEIIAVGTELLLGNITNTNASEISRALSAVGVNVFWHTVVGDNPERLREALDIARKRADVILTTGGLGPTYDDLTKQTVCETFGKPLVLREDVLEHIRTYFARNVHLTMPENNPQRGPAPRYRQGGQRSGGGGHAGPGGKRGDGLFGRRGVRRGYP